jgi:hypothetical protein
MKIIITAAVRWLSKNFTILLVIIMILAAADFLRNEIEDFSSVTAALSSLNSGRDSLKKYINKKQDETSSRVANFGNATEEKLKNRILEIDKEIQLKTSQQRSPLDRRLSFLTGQGVADDLMSDAEIKLLQQEKKYLGHLYTATLTRRGLETGRIELERLRKTHALIYRELTENESAQSRLEAEHPIAIKNPIYYEYHRLKNLKLARSDIYNKNQTAHEDYQKKKKSIEELAKVTNLPQFAIQQDQIDRVLQPLNERIYELDSDYRKNWLAKFAEPVVHVIPAALWMLLGIIFIPIAIKAAFYFLIAPLAARRPAIHLLPDVSGSIDGESENTAGETGGKKISAVSLSIEVNKNHELLIHPEYLQGSSHQGEKDTKWLLDYAFPMSSLASGMFALTRIRTTSPESHVVSDTKDPFSEIAVISIPEGSAIVFQPHSLIGVIQSIEHPLRISKHWRLGSMNGWLTLQLRYLVFHGEAKLIVKGCRGVRIEKAGAGRSINQAATIGFSANLAYSNTRCETFSSYLMGKQELFNDNFASGTGFYFYEEMPHFGKKTGITGRGLEGVTDSLLAIFGI